MPAYDDAAKEHVLSEFIKIDHNSDWFITETEFRIFIRSYSESFVPIKDIVSRFKDMDANEDHRVSFDEFEKYMREYFYDGISSEAEYEEE